MRRPLALLVFAAWLLLLTDGAWPQAQMAAFGERVPWPSIILKGVLLVLLGVFLLAALASGRLRTAPRPMLWWGLFVLYLGLQAGLTLGRPGFSAEYVLFGYNNYYFYLLILPVVFLLDGRLPGRSVLGLLALVFVPLALLGAAQFLGRDPILPTRSGDGRFEVYSWPFYGQVRAFSLFNSALSFSHYIALALALAAFLLVRSRRLGRLAALLLLGLGLAVGYFTLTRAAYVNFALVLGAALLIEAMRRSRWFKTLLVLPLLYGLLAALMAFALPSAVRSLEGRASLLSSDTLEMRHDEWREYGDLWLGRDLGTAMFGAGLVQNSNFEVSSRVLIDNTFLAVGVHVGLVGLLLWLALMWELWRFVLLRARSGGVLPGVVAAFWSAWLATGVFGITLQVYPQVLLLLPLAGALPVATRRPAPVLGPAEPA